MQTKQKHGVLLCAAVLCAVALCVGPAHATDTLPPTATLPPTSPLTSPTRPTSLPSSDPIPAITPLPGVTIPPTATPLPARPALLSAEALEALRARMGWRAAWQDGETGLVLFEAAAMDETNGLYGVADETGAQRFLRLSADPIEFSEGVALARYGDSFAFLLPDGRTLSDGWSYAQPFDGGYAMVVSRDGLIGRIDHEGKLAEALAEEPSPAEEAPLSPTRLPMGPGPQLPTEPPVQLPPAKQ